MEMPPAQAGGISASVPVRPFVHFHRKWTNGRPKATHSIFGQVSSGDGWVSTARQSERGMRVDMDALAFTHARRRSFRYVRWERVDSLGKDRWVDELLAEQGAGGLGVLGPLSG